MTRLALLALAALASIGAGSPRLALGGIGIGDPILDDIKRLGMPDAVAATDAGQFWQWLDKDGLDREVLTDDDLIVESVLVACARPASTAQPTELPLLRASQTAAQAAVVAAGGVALPGKNDEPDLQIWSLDTGYIVAYSGNGAVSSVRAIDAATARRFGFAGPPLVVPAHTAPALVRETLPSWLPQGAGTVMVRVSLDPYGKVVDTKVLVSSGITEVDRFETDTMRLSTFKPATCAGTPCASVYIDIGGLWR